MICIIGCGLAGSVMAISLAKLGIKVNLIDKQDHINKKQHSDGRTLAINQRSKVFLDSLGLWKELEHSATAIKHIKILELNSARCLNYDANLVNSDAMGYIVLYDILQDSINNELLNNKNINLVLGEEPKTYDVINKKLVLENQSIECELLIGADGRNSWVRAQSDIVAKTKQYGQNALVAHIVHEKPHNNTAYEIFTNNGPLAFLPMNNCSYNNIDDCHQSGIVWCKQSNFNWQEYDNKTLLDELFDLFPYFGRLHLNSKKFSFNLSCLQLNKIIADRVALIGDAAHGIHPIAGQGINLGWHDVQELSLIIKKAIKLGLDIGSYAGVLNEYNKKMFFNQKAMFLFTDFLNSIYKTNNPLIKFSRQFGISIIDKITPFKKIIVKKAMGI